MKRVIVTGGSGKLGRATVKDLRDHGYHVVNADTAPPSGSSEIPYMRVDFSDLNATVEALAGWDWDHTRRVDAVVHLAAIPMPGRVPSGDVFRVNTVTTYNVFEACRRLGIKNIVWASSETLLGIPYSVLPPYVPVDEEYPARPETAYSLSKFLGEEMATQFCRWDPELKIVCLRFSNVMEPEEYASFPGFEKDPGSRRFNLWTYIDARDGAQAIRKSIEAEFTGREVFVIANADGVMTTRNRDLLERFYPDLPLKRDITDHQSLLSIEKARRVLGYDPQHSWRDEVDR